MTYTLGMLLNNGVPTGLAPSACARERLATRRWSMPSSD